MVVSPSGEILLSYGDEERCAVIRVDSDLVDKIRAKQMLADDHIAALVSLLAGTIKKRSIPKDMDPKLPW